MLKKYRTVYIGAEAEIVEKKSRFIATVQPVKSEEEAVAFIESMRKKYWDARHNCFAYVIGDHFQIHRFSDDGEPGGTAGKPMLDVLIGEEIHDALVVVTRYFGGTLLGTGGLVRAYQSATKAGLEASIVIEKLWGCKLKISTDYTGLGKIQYLLAQRNLSILNTEYTDYVNMEVLCPMKSLEIIKAEITEGTNGQARIEEGEQCYFAEVEKEILIFTK